MRPLERNPQGLATLMMLLSIPHLALIFCRLLTSRAENWLWGYDPVIIVGYLALIVLFIFFWRAEATLPKITAGMPGFLLPAILTVLVLLPVLAFLGFSRPAVWPFLGYLMKLTFWGILVMAAIWVPAVAFRGDFSDGQKLLVALAALAYVVSPVTGPLFKLARERGLALARASVVVNLLSLLVYVSVAVLLYWPQAKGRAKTAFIAYCASLMLLAQGFVRPVMFGRRLESFTIDYMIGDYTASSIPVTIRTFNILVVGGVVILGLLWSQTRPLAARGKAD